MDKEKEKEMKKTEDKTEDEDEFELTDGMKDLANFLEG